MRKRLWAAFLSLMIPGVGQLYNARFKRAAMFYGVYAVLAVALFTGLLGRTFLALAVVVVAILAFRGGAAVLAAIEPGVTGSETRRWFSTWYGSVAVLAVLFLGQTFVLAQVQRLKTFYIPSSAMEATIQPGDRLVAALDAFTDRDPQRGELVLFDSPEQPGTTLLKRVVAIGGDTVAIRGKQLIIGGVPAVEPWVVHQDDRVFPPSDPPTRQSRRDNLEPFEIPAGHIFVLGDNRDFSYDSRYYGLVPRSALKGAPLYLYWSSDLSRIGLKFETP